MTPRETVVRVRDDAVSHGRHATRHRWADGRTALPRGQMIRVVLPAVKPATDAWTCDAEYVWRIPDDEVERLTGARPDGGHVYVCEHQVEVD